MSAEDNDWPACLLTWLGAVIVVVVFFIGLYQIGTWIFG